MDYGASFGYQTMDITRTWPVSGEFTELQERAYRAVLEAQKAAIAAMKPGVTRQETRTTVAKKIVEKWGFDSALRARRRTLRRHGGARRRRLLRFRSSRAW